MFIPMLLLALVRETSLYIGDAETGQIKVMKISLYPDRYIHTTFL